MSNSPRIARKGSYSLLKISLLAAGLTVFFKVLRGRQAVDFRGRVVAITGGSRGLGLNLARQLASQGAKVALIARDGAELERAREEIVALGAECLCVKADLRVQSEAEAAIDRVAAHFGHLDGLINNAGVMQIGPIEHMTQADFEDAMAVNFWAGLWCARAAVPHLKATGNGRIANIVSVGGQVAPPHMAPYIASKFAMKGFSDALRNEVVKDGILVSTICPGAIRSGSHVQIRYKGQHAKEYRILKMATAFPLGAIEVDSAARLILDAMKKGTPQLTFPYPVYLATIGYAAFPNLAALIAGTLGRLAPPPTDEGGDIAIPGHDLEGLVPPSKLTQLADRAVVANNETQRM